MPKFFVGQRVRVVSTQHEHNNWLIGTEQRIIAIDCDGDVKLESHPLPDGSTLISPWRLSPSLPSGHKAGDFSYEELLEHLETLSHENA